MVLWKNVASKVRRAYVEGKMMELLFLESPAVRWRTGV